MRGEKPERWIRQTDFSNDEAVGFLSDRLNRLGVEQKLVELGAVEGDPVLIGHPDNAVVFDFKPGIDAGAQMLGRRGEDQRFNRVAHGGPAPPRHRRSDARPRRGRDPGRRGPSLRRGARSDRTSTSATTGRTTTRGTTRNDPLVGHRRPARRGQGRVVLADDGAPAASTPTGCATWSTAWPAYAAGEPTSSWSPPEPSPPASRRWRSSGVPATSPASRRPRRWGRGCWCTATPRSSPGTARSPARCCSPSTT